MTQNRRKSWSISVELTLNSKTKLQRVFIGNFSSWAVIGGGTKDCRWWCETTPRAILQHHPKFGCLGSGNPKNVHKMSPLSELVSTSYVWIQDPGQKIQSFRRHCGCPAFRIMHSKNLRRGCRLILQSQGMSASNHAATESVHKSFFYLPQSIPFRLFLSHQIPLPAGPIVEQDNLIPIAWRSSTWIWKTAEKKVRKRHNLEPSEKSWPWYFFFPTPFFPGNLRSWPSPQLSS